MIFIPENFVNDDEIISAEGQGATINVRFCHSCPFFEIFGIQPDPSIKHGYCLRLSDEELPHYIRVTSKDFCNEDGIND